jgi:hypothetical protein
MHAAMVLLKSPLASGVVLTPFGSPVTAIREKDLEKGSGKDFVK